MPGGVRRGSGALHSVRYNERSQPEVLERRSPTGIARERETRTNNPAPRHAYKPTHPNRAESRRHGAPVSDRHRAGARNPHQRPHPPPISRLPHASPTAQNHADMERRSPTHRAGARNPQTTPPPANLTPTNPRPQPRRITPTWSAGLRPASRGSAKPAPTTPPPANPPPDRHRAGARNPHQQPRACKPTHPQPRRITPTWSAGLRPASRGSAKPAPTTPTPRQSHAYKPTHHQPRRITWSMERRSPTGIARKRETRTDDAHPTPISRLGAPVSDRHRCAKRSENRLNPNPRKARNRSAGLPPDRHRSPQAAKLPSPIPPWRSSAPN